MGVWFFADTPLAVTSLLCTAWSSAQSQRMESVASKQWFLFQASTICERTAGRDILAADSDEKRANASPVAILQKKGQELMGLPVLEKILFDSDGLTQGLKGKGATVKRVECGYNHWLLVFGFPTFATSFSWTAFVLSVSQAPQDAKLLEYEVKACKHTSLPSSLETRAFTTYTGEVHVHDVFGLPSTVKRHVVRLDLVSEALLTLQAEVHRDTPTTLAVDVFRRGDSGKGASRVLLGRNMLGAGGEDTKAFLHGLLSGKDLKVDIVFDLVSVDVVSSQVDSKVSEAKCWPVRIDLTAVPTTRAGLHWPSACPTEDRLPKPGTSVVVLGDRGLESSAGASHFVYRFAEERPWTAFQKPLWSSVLEAQPRLHRFVRIFMRVSFRFASGPLEAEGEGIPERTEKRRMED
eukprot:g2900.t1